MALIDWKLKGPRATIGRRATLWSARYHKRLKTEPHTLNGVHWPNGLAEPTLGRYMASKWKHYQRGKKTIVFCLLRNPYAFCYMRFLDEFLVQWRSKSEEIGKAYDDTTYIMVRTLSMACVPQYWKLFVRSAGLKGLRSVSLVVNIWPSKTTFCSMSENTVLVYSFKCNLLGCLKCAWLRITAGCVY